MLLHAITIAATIFIAELGDKTQLFVMGLASKEKISDIIIGVTAATVLLNLIGVHLGVMLSGFMRLEIINLAAGFCFLIFAYLALMGEKKGESVTKSSGIAALSIGIMFFMAELGDKTQLSAVAFAAQNPELRTAVFVGVVSGMLLADGVGLLIGMLLGKKLPQRVFSLFAFLIFCAFGFVSIWRGAATLAPERAVLAISITAIVYLALVLSGIVPLMRKKRQKSCA